MPHWIPFALFLIIGTSFATVGLMFAIDAIYFKGCLAQILGDLGQDACMALVGGVGAIVAVRRTAKGAQPGSLRLAVAQSLVGAPLKLPAKRRRSMKLIGQR